MSNTSNNMNRTTVKRPEEKQQKETIDRKYLAFDKINFILLGIGMAVVIIGFILMSGSGSAEGTFDPDIFSARRIKVAPAVCFLGFIFMIYAVIRKPKDSSEDK